VSFGRPDRCLYRASWSRILNCGFASGRIVDVQASANADVLRAQLGADEGDAYLGEVALVGGSSRVGELGITFLDSMTKMQPVISATGAG
jgi:leucyl aminopeptidase (aminopeptidase T)